LLVGDRSAISIRQSAIANPIVNRQSDRQSPIANRIATHYSSIVDPIGNRQSHIFN
jgi:hypothetical protein